ncbi:DUF72 domain-containing protein [Bacillus marinisedimentorum]|uniref:DUF72 domain-containing protein n=1 Tax=Bacillus marinisedimentorum TaxID=1821260 RepID=UPI0008725BC6|nr:DUF72 domain-containing protein [Bacillus marinisedimentorum]
MIYIGVTGWGDHDTLYPPNQKSRDKLKVYAGHFPVVEVDSSFYAIPAENTALKWLEDTPDGFSFVIKAYSAMTGHKRTDIPFESKDEMYDAFLSFLEPFAGREKLAMVLFQFPPWFDAAKPHVEILRDIKRRMGSIPVALEFRNRTWFTDAYYKKTLEFMHKESWIHSVVDEPDAGVKSIPTVLKATDREKTLVRMHGRNRHGWNGAAKGQNWRDVRYLYRYNKTELLEWKEKLFALEKQSGDVYVVFNNNSGGDAADNAKMMIELLGVSYTELAPRQLDLFE